MANITDSITNINFLSQDQFNSITAPSNNELYAVEFTPKGFNLFDYKLSNYTLNDPRWLSANAFTWQYCDYVDENYQGYSIAYNHLLDDWNTGTIVTETIGSHTFSVKVAPDGHKLFSSNGLTLVETLYAEMGAADYFIIDTENKRFKLPRKQKRQLIASWNSGYSWYKIYSDGWVEQGGRASPSATDTWTTQTLHITMKNTQYNVFMQPTISTSNAAGNSSQRIVTVCDWGNRTTSSFTYITNSISGTSTVSSGWEVHGYAASVPTQTQLEYYYVGEYTIPALENTAGINTETLNNKADISDVSHLAFPSNQYISLPTTDASGTVYTAPADGWYTYRGGGTGSTVGQYVVLESSSGLSMNCFVTTAGNTVRAYLPVSKGQTCTWKYTTTTHAMWRFVYANGAS